MVNLNRQLLPIKAHYFFFMAAMGPILPQLSVWGKQIGIEPEIMGYITSVLPVMYVLAKPLFGFLADYFTNSRKLIFIGLIMTMTTAYGAFCFLPEQQACSIPSSESLNITFQMKDLPTCKEELLTKTNLCDAIYKAHCPDELSKFEAFAVNIFNPTIHYLNLSSNYNESTLELYICVTEKTSVNQNVIDFNVTCDFRLTDRSRYLYSSSAFWFFVLLMFVGTIGFNVTNSISDAICFDMLGESGGDKYGAQRVWGTLGFGATALLSGIVVDYWTMGDIKSIGPALMIMLIFSGLDLLSVSKLNLPKLTSSESIFKDVWDLIKHPSISIFLVFATIAGIIDSFIIYFMFWHLEEVAEQTGFIPQIKLIEGCVVAAECLAGEIPFFFYSGKIIKKLGYIHCMSLCFFFYAVRLALISWIPNPWYLVGVELFFQGSTYALCYTCIVAYASAVAPPGTSATVQGLMAGVDDGLGFSIGSLIGGLSFKRFGGRRSFMYFSIVAIFTCIAHIIIRPSSRKRQYLPKSGYQVPVEHIGNTLDMTEEDVKS